MGLPIWVKVDMGVIERKEYSTPLDLQNRSLTIGWILISNQGHRWCPCGIMVKALDCRYIVSEFELPSGNYVHFKTNNLGKSMNPLILSAMV